MSRSAIFKLQWPSKWHMFVYVATRGRLCKPQMTLDRVI